MRKLNHFDPSKIAYHGVSEKIVNHISAISEVANPAFFRIIVAYQLTKVAAQMRASVRTHNGALFPINNYSIALAPSGYGKTRNMMFMDKELLGPFMKRFKHELLPYAAEQNLVKLATERASIYGTDCDAELRALQKEYEDTGKWINAFDAATASGLKQFRHKLLLSSSGSLNFEIDEIGDNLTSNTDAFSKYLELYDSGLIKESLIKNTKENARFSEIEGNTPTNMIIFGTPSSLLDGSKKEDEFYEMLEKGYARRSFFAFVRNVERETAQTAEEIFNQSNAQQASQLIEDLSEHLLSLCDPINFKKELHINKDEEMIRIEYNMYCQDRANQISEFDIIRKIEMEHRAFKAFKLAAAYAFIEGESEIKERHLYNAIAIAEESGEQLADLLARDKPYVKLAKYLGAKNQAQTQADLVENLPFYKGTNAQKSEMLTLATAWGYNNLIVIKKSYQDGIEFLTGESLKETNTDELIVSYSDHMAYNYVNEVITWDQLQQLCVTKDYHWVSHHLHDGHRCEDKTKTGFNLLVIDVDGEISLTAAQELLKEYQCLFYTTKRHQTDGQDRFRIVFPMRFHLKLEGSDYREFMQAVYNWLPFEVDEQTSQRSRKWLTNDNATVVTNEGELFDPISFIPKTTKNEQRKQRLIDQESFTNLERWFINNTGAGNRSNQLIKYAYLLIDSGKTLSQVEQAVLSLNEKIQDKLPEEEIMTTIMVSARKHFTKQQTI